MNRYFKGLIHAVACAALVGGVSAASAETITLRSVLAGSSEVPAKAVPGTGVLTATLDTQTNVLHWKLSYSGLTGDATAAHFHGPAPVGQNAGVAVPFKAPYTSPMEGEVTLTAAQTADLLAGNWYVNIHTPANPGGELRGQVDRGN